MHKKLVLVVVGLIGFLWGCSGVKSGSVKMKSDSLGRRAACASGSLSCTPEDLGGRLFSGGAMLNSTEGYNITLIGASESVIEDPSQGMGGTIAFSLLGQTVFGSSYSAPGEDHFEGNPNITEMEFNFDYLDAEFTLTGTSGGGADDTWIVRTVYATTATADDVSGTMQKGDKLIKADGRTNFQWCNAGGCSDTRSAVASGIYQDAAIVGFSPPAQGNQNYVRFEVTLSTPLTPTFAQLDAGGITWVANFNVANAITFAATPATLGSRQAVLNAFQLEDDPANPSIQVALTIE